MTKNNRMLPDVDLLGSAPSREAGTSGGTVSFRSVLESEAWKNSRAEMPLAIGEDAAGKPVIVDLDTALHILIFGQAASGRTECMNSLIMSLLFRFSSEELKFLLIDPSGSEMTEYRHLPHLAAPIVTDGRAAADALRRVAGEMEKRYRILAKAHMKNLRDYNRRPAATPAPLDDDGLPLPDAMPYLVVIIDDLSGIMLDDVGPEAEDAIVRIAQKGRAAGIHLILAARQPGANIITGRIKANCPTCICFRTASGDDSRAVLDVEGAEKLPDSGAMLLRLPLRDELLCIQGTTVPCDDLHKVVEFVCRQTRPEAGTPPERA